MIQTTDERQLKYRVGYLINLHIQLVLWKHKGGHYQGHSTTVLDKIDKKHGDMQINPTTQ